MIDEGHVLWKPQCDTSICGYAILTLDKQEMRNRRSHAYIKGKLWYDMYLFVIDRKIREQSLHNCQ